MLFRLSLSILFFSFLASGCRQTAAIPDQAPVQHMQYELDLSIDLDNQSLHGRLQLQLPTDHREDTLVLNHGRLTIDTVFGEAVIHSWQEGRKRYIQLTEAHSAARVNLTYHGQPKRGISFGPASVHTHYFTEAWMPCLFEPDQRASFLLHLRAPDSLEVIGTGDYVGEKLIDAGQKQTTWHLKRAMPAYTYGFAAGVYEHYMTTHADSIALNTYSDGHSPAELAQIFTETSQMMDFFSEKAGLAYPFEAYTEIIAAGNVSQEMSGYAVLRGSYGEQVLNDSSQINLSAHELAHQWWGNRITCRTWQHFWLNEGMAVFMSSAFIEQRFGRAQYLADIQLYQDAWQKVPDHPLVYDNWLNPKAGDRVIVYYKGACFLHQLRETLGEAVFWAGIRQYSQRYDGQSVDSHDFQKSMEEAAGKSLQSLFDEWVWPN